MVQRDFNIKIMHLFLCVNILLSHDFFRLLLPLFWYFFLRNKVHGIFQDFVISEDVHAHMSRFSHHQFAVTVH